MSESENVMLLKRAYAAFNQGDIPGLIEMFAPAVEWEWPAVKEIPHSGNRRGREEVRKFFETILSVEEPVDFRQDEFVAQGDRVLVLGTYRARAKATGRTWETRFAHAWTIRAGQLQKYESFYDTAAAVAAYSK